MLAHGGAHGSWCWDLVRPHLLDRGWNSVAPEVPLDNPAAGLMVCADLVAGAAPSDENDVVVVAHSASGAFLPLAAAKCRARLMMFLCAVVPVEGKSWVEQVMDDPTAIPEQPRGVSFDALGRAVFSVGGARDYFFADCAPDISDSAARRLVPFAQTVPSEPFPTNCWPDIPAAYIFGTLDRAVSPKWSRRVARERLRTTAEEIPTGHSPFLAQPVLLAETLIRLASQG